MNRIPELYVRIQVSAGGEKLLVMLSTLFGLSFQSSRLRFGSVDRERVTDIQIGAK